MSRSRPLSVYVIGCESGPQKIGVSDSLDRRLTHLQTGRSTKLHLAFSWGRPAGDARLVERAAHNLLSAKRHEGEWFNVSIDAAIAAVNHAIKMVDAGEVSAPAARARQENVIGIRLDEKEHESLKRAAREDDRTISALVRRIIIEWLEKKESK